MLQVARIRGGHVLKGSVRAAGSKNAALPLLAASLLTGETVTLRNVPDLSDVRYMAEILGHQGATVANPAPGVWTIRAGQVSHRTPYDLVRKMRASVCLLGSLVGRLRQAEMAIPGGCVIGPRPIDLHLKGLEALGCVVTVEAGLVSVDAAHARGASAGSAVACGANMLVVVNWEDGACTQLRIWACAPRSRV
jgi:UDP-N-acetylglucosamine 1-carboxyvinyltransferase